MNRRTPLFAAPGELELVDAHAPLLESIREGKLTCHAMGRGHYPGARFGVAQLPGLLSAGYWDATGEQGWGMDFHRNEGVEICLLETGSMQFAVDGEAYPLEPGCITITRPWQAHRQGNPHVQAGRLHWAIISVGAVRPDQQWKWPSWVLLAPGDRRELSRRLRHTRNPVWKASPDIVRGFARVARAAAQESGGRRISQVAVGVNELLLGILELLRSENRPERPGLASREHTVELFLNDLKNNPGSLEKNWSLARMAAACGMGTTLFSQLCRRLTNASPMHYLNIARLDAAARLLGAEPGRRIIDVALDCGFQTSQYFAYQFHRRFGITPSECQRRRLRPGAPGSSPA